MSYEVTSFIGGEFGDWNVEAFHICKGSPISEVRRLEISTAAPVSKRKVAWTLKGVESNLRYTTLREKELLQLRPSLLGKTNFTKAALIPIKKTEDWWLLAQDQRRNILEEQSRHISFGSKYLDVVSRKLFHSKDLGQAFDFITWFEFPPDGEDAFDLLVHTLRQSEEWKYVEREIDIRLSKELF